MMYLLAYLDADRQLEHRLEISPQVHHMFPLCCLPDWEMGREFVHMCKHGILQYTAVRPITTLISLYVYNEYSYLHHRIKKETFL